MYSDAEKAYNSCLAPRTSNLFIYFSFIYYVFDVVPPSHPTRTPTPPPLSVLCKEFCHDLRLFFVRCFCVDR